MVWGGRLLAGAVLLVGLALSTIATLYVERATLRAAEARFTAGAEEMVVAIEKRMDSYVGAMRSVAALFAASTEVTREEYRRFITALALRRTFPGSQGIGFVVSLQGGEDAQRELRERYRDYLLDGAIDRRTAVVMIEPLDTRNLRALGSDLYRDPVQREAMARARDTGEPSASLPIRLTMDGDETARLGFYIFLPVYAGGVVPTTVQLRRDQLLGWVYGLFLSEDLIEGIFGGPIPVHLEIAAGEVPGQPLYSSPSPAEDGFEVVRRTEVAGQTWTLALRGHHPLGDGGALLPPLVLLASALVTLLLFAITWSQVRAREAAEQLTERLLASEDERTRLLEAERRSRHDAEESRRRFAFLADASGLIASSLDAPEILERIARRAVPFLGDGCAIDLWEPDGELRRQVIVCRDPTVEATLKTHQLGRSVTAPAGSSLRQAAERGELVLLADVPESAYAGEPAPVRTVLRQLLGSLVAVPIPGRDAMLGQLLFASAERHRYRDEDRQLAGELARRVALALDNARLYRDAQKAVALRDEFLSIASHELRTPLTTLQAHLQSMLRALRRGVAIEGEQLQQRLETALRQTRRLGRLVEELLEVSRFSRGRLRLEPERFDLAALGAELVESMRGEAERAGCEIRLAVRGNTLGEWDRNRIEQALANLVSNAIKYGAGQPIDLEVEGEDDRVRFSVRDRGIGIEAEAQSRIFGRFERASSRRHYGGLGLGLHISSQIVAAHGGRISVRSAPGEGATFTVELPRRVPPAGEAETD